MSDTESIFNPLDDSLKERVRAYYAVCKAIALSEASRDQSEQYIGDAKQVSAAHKVLVRSLKVASQDVTDSDLQNAKQKGFLSDSEMVNILQLRRQQKIQEQRDIRRARDNSLSQRGN